MQAVSSRPFSGFFPVSQPSSPTILLVDDNPDVLAALSATLRMTGYQVVPCQGATAAIQTAATRHFDLLVSDFDLPQMNGFELAAALSLEKPSLPVVLISGLGPEDLPHRHVLERGWDLMFKPIDAGRLIGGIESQLSRSKKPVASVPAFAAVAQHLAS